MTTTAPQTDADFQFMGTGYSPTPTTEAPAATPGDGIQLGPLTQLEGTWRGNGFNTIWRPNFSTDRQDRFLELNITTETLAFTRINGAIPNRGLVMPDIEMFGLTYMQQIAQTDNGAGLHIEPGIWASVPRTSNPRVNPTVVRMASIPHGTVILAQGQAIVDNPGGPQIADNNIIPFPIGSPPPPNSDFDNAAAKFTELDLSKDTKFRFISPGVDQHMVKNPNIVLMEAIQGQNIKSTTVLIISTKHTPTPGGGTANTAFLEDASTPGGNANAAEVDAIFWIETVEGENGDPDYLQLQYTQLVQLDFAGLRWPHVTVATLLKVSGQAGAV